MGRGGEHWHYTQQVARAVKRLHLNGHAVGGIERHVDPRKIPWIPSAEDELPLHFVLVQCKHDAIIVAVRIVAILAIDCGKPLQLRIEKSAAFSACNQNVAFSLVPAQILQKECERRVV